jgi:hypothetical protein
VPVPPPDWVSLDAKETGGLDLLGLRAPVQQIGNRLLNGLTSVTPKLRYLPFLAWIIWRYALARLPDDSSAFWDFAAAQEAAVVMANLVNDRVRSRSTLRLIGVDQARGLLNSGRQSFPLEPLVDNIAFGIYASATIQLNLSFQTSTRLYGLSEERGLPLALAFDKTISSTRYAQRLVQRRRVDRASRADIEELGRKMCLDDLPAREKRILIDAILPPDPEDDAERRRIATFALLLWLSAKKKSSVDETDLFEAAREPPRAVPTVFKPALDGWLDYQIRDVLAVTHEAVMAAVMAEVDLSAARRRAPALASDVIVGLLAATDDHNDALREIGLLGNTESVRRMRLSDILARVRRACQDQQTFANGLRRWRGGLSEDAICTLALAAGPAAAALLPVAWCLAAHRVRQEDGPTGELRKVAHDGELFQIGLAAVVIPKLDEFVRTKRTYLDTMGELITRTVQQHLRVAWQRFATQGQDVSVLAADLRPGRASRSSAPGGRNRAWASPPTGCASSTWSGRRVSPQTDSASSTAPLPRSEAPNHEERAPVLP